MKHNSRFSKSAIVRHYTSDCNDSSCGRINVEENSSVRGAMLKIRSYFASMCESSFIAGALERLYLSLLACPLSVLGVFLTVFSLVSISLRFFVSGNGLSFFFNGINLSAIMIFLVSLTFLPVKKSISELVSKSIFLSKFEISYDSKILKASSKGEVPYYSYSTAVFLGMLCGIVSALLSPVSVLSYMALLVCSLIIFNRPECGILTSAFMLPLLENRYVILVTALTAFSFLYKYLRCKRHFYFGKDEKILFACTLIFFVSGIFTKSGIISITDSLKFVAVTVIYLCVKNLIKSISLFNGCVKLISVSSALLSFVVILYYIISSMADLINIWCFNGAGLSSSLGNFLNSDSHTFAVIAMTLPLNFSLFLGNLKSGTRLRYGITVLMQLFCIAVNRDIGIITACVFSMILVLAFRYFKSLLLLPFTPLITHLLLKASHFLPSMTKAMSTARMFDKSAFGIIASALYDNPLFGIGIGSENFRLSVASYSVAGSSSLQHPETSFISLVLSFGIPASIIIIATVGHLISKNLRFAIVNKGKNQLCDTASSGLFASCVCAVFLFFTMFFTSHVSAAALFAVMLGLGCCADDCVNSDFIDNNRQR